MTGRAVLALLIVVAFLAFAAPIRARTPDCQACHAEPALKRVLQNGRTQSLYVDGDQVRSSVHGDRACVDCHADAKDGPHTVAPAPVNCTRCHYKDSGAGVPQTGAYEAYKRSVHGKAVANGDPKAPACQDCHGSHGIRSHSDPLAQVARPNVPATCGACHLEAYAQYRASIHGAGAEDGNVDVPVCTGCHSEHGILSRKDPSSSTYVANVSGMCARCHAAEAIVGKYGIEAGQVDSYDESYHGVSIRAGDRTVANCASCHGIHNIRSPEDPASSVHIDNIPQTCGKCHPGADASFARGKIHARPTSPESGIVFYAATFFKWLTILTVCGLITHILLDLVRKIRAR
jgi:hypothetical protein